MNEFKMPALGADMERGTVVEWRIKPGEKVERGQIVAEVETEKGVMEVEIWSSGTIQDILVPVGTTVPVGTPLARVSEVGAQAETQPEDIMKRQTHAAATPRARPAATPLARRIAQEYDLDLLQIKGTGPHGAITRNDVESAAHPTPPVKSHSATESDRAILGASADSSFGPDDMHRRLESMRLAIAKNMERSKKEIPHYYLRTDVDAGPLLAELERINAGRSAIERLLPIATIVRAVALAARVVPTVNGFWQGGRFEAARSANVGLAVSLKGGGLIAPALMHCDEKPADRIMKEILDLVARARRGKLRGAEMTEATLTLTSLGDQGVDEVYGVIYPPQVALVGAGTIRSRPWARGDLLGVRPIFTLTLSGDHRASDGHSGGNFLQEVQRTLENPRERGLL
jgi:pyruvate dehydrogenase E2 component (dihydrolipoamide acetyltransferase)